MKKFNGYEDAMKRAEFSATDKLPAGGYVCRVIGVKYEENERGDRIIIQFDIEEGDYKDFFKNLYNANTSEDKKYKGIARINVPKDDGSEKDGFTKNRFARWTDGFQRSNEGYSWDWDENKWNGKLIGITFGETGTVIDGKEIVYTEARSGCPVEAVRSGKFYMPKFVKKNGYTGTGSVKTSSDDFMKIPSNAAVSEIPF